jgi:hypothetical protein
MMPQQAQAMMTGINQGQQQANSILPSVYQPKGKAAARNPWEGSLDIIADQLLTIASQINDQGGAYRDHTEELYALAYKVKKTNNALTKCAQEGNEDAA